VFLLVLDETNVEGLNRLHACQFLRAVKQDALCRIADIHGSISIAQRACRAAAELQHSKPLALDELCQHIAVLEILEELASESVIVLLCQVKRAIDDSGLSITRGRHLLCSITHTLGEDGDSLVESALDSTADLRDAPLIPLILEQLVKADRLVAREAGSLCERSVRHLTLFLTDYLGAGGAVNFFPVITVAKLNGPDKIDGARRPLVVSQITLRYCHFCIMEPVNNKKVKFVLVRTEYIEWEFDREEYDSLFLEIYEDPHTPDEEKRTLQKEADRVWEKLLNRKRPLVFHEETPIIRQPERLWGHDWFESISEPILRAMSKTYKEFGNIIGLHFNYH